MSSPYDHRGSSRRRNAWGHWVPLALTVTVATVGLAAWVWSQRNNEEEHDDNEPVAPDLDYENADYGDNPPYGASRDDPGYRPPTFTGGDLRPGEPGYAQSQVSGTESAPGWGARMSGALRRTPSPQQFLEGASKSVVAGVTAAGAAVGSALAAIREEDKNAYADHETWSEEADAKEKHEKHEKRAGPSSQPRDPSKKRKTVVLIVSADTHFDDLDDDEFHEHGSILSHIPRHNDFNNIKLFVLIYAPGLKDAPGDNASNLPPPSLSSSFSNIEHDQAQTPGTEAKSPPLTGSAGNPAFNAVYSQAVGLVEKEAMVLPFTSPNGHVHILRHLQPDVIYLQESLAGDNGSVVTHLQTWLRHDIILVVGAESGHGGLADSESEAEKPEKAVEKWWHREDRVGRGRGVIVVDSMRVHDDWARRVQGKE